VPFSTIWSIAAYVVTLPSSSWTARRGWKRQSQRSETACPVQRCTLHKHRNLLAHAPERLHDEISADYADMIYEATPEEMAARRKAFIRKWRLRHRAVAGSLEEAGDRLFTFTRLPPTQWRSARTTNAIERLYEEVQATDQSPGRAAVGRYCCDAVLGPARLRQIRMRKVDGWQTLATNPIDHQIDLPDSVTLKMPEITSRRIPTQQATAPAIKYYYALMSEALCAWALLRL
jgi:hypothetical protein